MPNSRANKDEKARKLLVGTDSEENITYRQELKERLRRKRKYDNQDVIDYVLSKDKISAK